MSGIEDRNIWAAKTMHRYIELNNKALRRQQKQNDHK